LQTKQAFPNGLLSKGVLFDIPPFFNPAAGPFKKIRKIPKNFRHKVGKRGCFFAFVVVKYQSEWTVKKYTF